MPLVFGSPQVSERRRFSPYALLGRGFLKRGFVRYDLTMRHVLLLPLLFAAPAVAQERSDAGDGRNTGQRAEDGNTIFDPAPLTGTIGTGRPSFSTGTTSVPTGRLQIELGLTYTRDGDDDQITAPANLLRYGIHDHAELRLGGAAWVGGLNDDQLPEGQTDLRLGVKLEAFRPDEDDPRWFPKVAVQPSLKLPTGDLDPSDQIDPAVQVAASWSLPGNGGLLLNVGLFTDSDGHDTATSLDYGLLHARTLSDDVSVFVEVFGSASDTFDDTLSADVGVLYLLDDNTQLDAFVGAGLNDAAGDLFAGAGISFRL